MDIQTLQRGEVTVITVAGSVDSLNAEQFTDAFSQPVKQARVRLVADLAGVSYTSSAGLRSLLSAVKECRRLGGDLRIAAVQPAVQRILSLSGFTSIIKVFDDVEAAVASYGAQA